MEEKLFRVAIKDKRYNNNTFILGHITGVARIMFGMQVIQHFDLWHTYFGIQSMTVRTTKRKFNEFRKVIEEWDSNLCDFDMEVDETIVELFGEEG